MYLNLQFYTETVNKIYEKLFSKYRDAYPIKVSNPDLFTTLHYSKDGSIYAVILNHSKEEKCFEIYSDGYTVDKIFYGKVDTVAPYDASVIRFTTK